MEVRKNKNANTSLYITLVIILVVLAGAVATASVISRRSEAPAEDVGVIPGTDLSDDIPVIKDEGETKKEDETSDTEIPATDKEPEKETESEKDENAAATEDAVTDAAETEAENSKLPIFANPVSGGVINEHSDTVPVFSTTMNDYRTHIGVDLAAEEGEAVRAAADGVIGAIYDDPMMGKCLTVIHSGNAVSTYKGLYETLPEGIAAGAQVKCGQVLAAAGDSALIEVAEESHVHFELAIDGKNVDPCLYIDFTAEEKYEG